MDVTAFLVDALGSALELGVATPDDVLKHATPDVLAAHLPRPEWAKLIAACLAAPRVDARLVVDTIGVPTLCRSVPGAIVWACLVEIGQRALGKSILAPPPARSDGAPAGKASPFSTPPTGVPTVAAPATASTPAGVVAAPASSGGSGAVAAPQASTGSGAVATPASGLPSRTSTLRMGAPGRTETPPTGVPIPRASSPMIAVDEPPPLGAPPSTGARLPGVRADSARPEAARTAPPAPAPAPANGVRTTGAGASTRRPQAQAPGASTRPGSRTTPPPPGGPSRRPTTGADFDIDTDLSSDWKKADPLAVDDEQLVDWAQADETSTSGPNDRKR
jgi:hypothetical protein